jgi:hypothetical protein
LERNFAELLRINGGLRDEFFLKVSLIGTVIFISACATLRPHERIAYQELEPKLEKLELEPLHDKSAALAGTLNVLPGVGNAYLGQWGMFICNFLLWPASVLWGVPQAIIDTDPINKRDTLTYYKVGLGKALLEEREATHVQKEK